MFDTFCFVLFVVIPFILDVRLHLSVNMWTHQPGSHRGKATQAFFFLQLPSAVVALLFFIASHPFPSSTVKSNFVYPRRNRSLLVGHDA